MDKTRLYIKGVTQLRQFGNIGLIVLTDADQTKHLSMPCNMDRLYDLEGFCKKRHTSVDALISVLWTIIRDHTGAPYEVHVTDVSSGKYRMELQDVEKSIAYKLEPTAAITLAAVADLPIYISPQLFDIQGVDYNPDNEKVSFPLNVLSYELLENALRRAVKDEDYRMAMAIKQEMDNRKNKKL